MPRTRPSRQYVNSVALSFYNAKLRDNPNLRRSCSDRHILDDTIDQWRNEERLDGRPVTGVSRSDIIFGMKNPKMKLIDFKVTEENIIVWREEREDVVNDNSAEEGRLPETKSVAVNDKANRIARTVARIRNSRAELESNRNGIIIDNVEWEANVCRIGERMTQNVSIRNDSDTDVWCTVKSEAARQRGILIEGESTFELIARSSYSIPFSFLPKRIGITKSIVIFDFSPIGVDEDNAIEAFSIARYISIRAGDPDDYDIIKPTAPFIKKQQRYDDGHKFANPVRVKNTGGVKTQFTHDLGRFPIPADVERLAANEKEATWELDKMFRGEESSYFDVDRENIDYSTHLTTDNYAKCMQRLLWLEEAQMKGEIK